MDTSLQSRARSASWVGLLFVFGFGVFLRSWRLADQIPGGDEAHGLRAAARHGFGYLVKHNAPSAAGADYSIPLALWNRLLLETVGLDEWGLRLPVFVCGVLAIAMMAGVAGRALGRTGALVAAAITAISPLLVMYSRFARPYGCIFLLFAVGLLAALRFRVDGRRRSAWIANLAVGIALFFNLSAAGGAVAVWVSGIAFPPSAPGLEPGSARRRWAASAAFGVLVAAILIAPSLIQQSGFLEDKAGAGRFPTTAWWFWPAALFGVHGSVSLPLVVATMTAGAFSLSRRAPALARLCLAVLILQAVSILVVRPSGAHSRMVFARYMMPAAPGLILFFTCGLLSVTGWLRALPWRRFSSIASSLACGALLAGIYLTGPLPSLYGQPRSFTSHRDYYQSAPAQVVPDRVPAIYAELEASEGSVLETPWPSNWQWTIYHHYQALHGRLVKTLTLLMVDDFLHPGLRLRTFASLGTRRIVLGDAQHVLVHKDLVGEKRHVLGIDEESPDESDATRQRYVRDAAMILAVCRADRRLRVVYEDEWLVAFRRRAKP